MSTGIVFESVPNKQLCALNVSNDCLGFIDITESFVDEEGQAWNVCPPCAENERQAVARRAEGDSRG